MYRLLWKNSLEWWLDGFFICGPGDWTFFGTPLFWSYGDLLSGPRSDRICVEDLSATIGPPWLVTEAPDHQQTAYILLQILAGWGQVLQTVLVPSPIHWYICWRGWGLSCIPVSLSHTCCFIMSYVFHPTPLSINLYSRSSCQICWNQQSMRSLSLCFVLFVCQLGCAGWIRGLSYGNLVKSQFDICSVHCFRWENVPVCC